MLGSRSTSSGLYNFGTSLRKAYPNTVTMPQFFASHGYRTVAKERTNQRGGMFRKMYFKAHDTTKLEGVTR